MEDRLGSVRKRKLSFRIKFEVSPHRSVPAVGTGQKTRSGRGAHCGSRIALCEPDTATREGVDVRSLEILLPVAAQIPPAKIIRQDEHDVRSTCRFLFSAGSCGESDSGKKH